MCSHFKIIRLNNLRGSVTTWVMQMFIPSLYRRRKTRRPLPAPLERWKLLSPAGWHTRLQMRCCRRASAGGTRERWWSPWLQGLDRETDNSTTGDMIRNNNNNHNNRKTNTTHLDSHYLKTQLLSYRHTNTYYYFFKLSTSTKAYTAWMQQLQPHLITADGTPKGFCIYGT